MSTTVDVDSVVAGNVPDGIVSELPEPSTSIDVMICPDRICTVPVDPTASNRTSGIHAVFDPAPASHVAVCAAGEPPTVAYDTAILEYVPSAIWLSNWDDWVGVANVNPPVFADTVKSMPLAND
jgi:hypothetical protein